MSHVDRFDVSSRRMSIRRARRMSRAVLETLEQRRLLSGTPAVWTGTANDHNWSTAANWQGNTLPAAGQDVQFPDLGAMDFVNVNGPVTVGALSLDHTVLQGSAPITLQGDITTDSSTESAILDPIVLTRNTTATVPFNLVLGGVISDGGHGFGLDFTGGGSVNMGAYQNIAGTVGLGGGSGSIVETYSGTTVIDSNTVYVIGSLASAVQAENNGAIVANGSIGGFVGTDAEIYPTDEANGSPATLIVQDGFTLDSNSALAVFVENPSSGAATSSTLDVQFGTINLGDAVLDGSGIQNFTPAIGTQFTLIHNETGRPIQSTLNGLRDGAVTSLAGANYEVSYHGGSGNDLVLTAVHPPTHIAVQSSAATAIIGHAVTLTATVTGTDANNDSPSGTVRFYQGNTLIGNAVALGSNGIASIQTKLLAAGTDVINAVYSGDANFNRTNAVTDATTVNVVVDSTVKFVRAHAASTATQTAILSALASDTVAPGETGLTYSWTLLTEPAGAKTPVLSKNRTHSARTTTARVYKDGSYLYQCTATDAEGEYAIADIRLTVNQTATSIRITPHGEKIRRGHSAQFSTVVLDQFNHPLRTTPDVHYSIVSGSGSINHSGLLIAGQTAERLILEAGVDGVDGTVVVAVI